MSEIEEKVLVSIEEDEDNEDIVIEMNTADGIAQFTTFEEIKGCFNALILSSDKKVNVKIDSELGYNIFEMKEYPANLGDPETTYIPIRTQAWNEDGHQIGFLAEPFKLNEKIVLTIQGQPNTNVRFILRVE